MDDDLDALIARVSPDLWLASRFIANPAERADVIALYAYDHELSRAPRATSNALMGEIRLTWWREVLDEIFESRPVRRHPAAQGLAGAVSRRNLPRASLEAMLDARYDELGGRRPEGADRSGWADGVGGALMDLSARILDPASTPAMTASAGRLFALGRLGAAPSDLQAERRRARREVRALSVAAFPAVLPAALAGRGAAPALSRRIRLTWSAATGRI